MDLTDFATQEITRLLEQKNCNQDQIELALNITDYYVTSKSDGYEIDTTKEDVRRLENAVSALKKAQISISSVNPYIFADVNERVEYHMNSYYNADDTLEEPLSRLSQGYSFLDSSEFITALIQSAQMECEHLRSKKKNERLMESIADCWIRFSELFDFEFKKVDLCDFAHCITEIKIDTLKNHFAHIQVPKPRQPEFNFDTTTHSESKVLVTRSENFKYRKTKARRWLDNESKGKP